MMPHGICLLWDSRLIAMHSVSDALIATAYYAIPVVLFHARRWLTDMVGRLLLVMFAAFILACGTTHVMDIVVLWWPAYWLQGVVKIVTAVLSVGTGTFLVRLLFSRG